MAEMTAAQKKLRKVCRQMSRPIVLVKPLGTALGYFERRTRPIWRYDDEKREPRVWDLRLSWEAELMDGRICVSGALTAWLAES